MPDPKSRARVERLLRGDFRPDDLTSLFLYARDRCDGREPVQEIGDFVAHHNERTKGIVSRSAHDWFTIVRFMAPRFAEGGPYALNGERLPPNTPEFLGATVRRLDNKIIKRDTGLSRLEAQRALPDAIKKLEKNPDGSYRVTPAFTRKEIAIVQCLCSYLTVRPVFESNRLFEDFVATLKSHGLVQKTELRDFARLKTAVELYAVSAMHNCDVRLPDGTRMKLEASPRVNEPAVSVMTSAPIRNEGQPNEVGAVFDLFTVPGDPSLLCEPELLAVPDWAAVELEVKASMRLGRI